MVFKGGGKGLKGAPTGVPAWGGGENIALKKTPG